MRKYISGILIIVLLFDIGGYYLELCFWQGLIHREINRTIDQGCSDEDLTLVVLPISSHAAIRWTNPGKEFMYLGEMYDVVKMSIHQQQVFYHCIKDSKEKQLLVHFNRHKNQKKDTWKKVKLFSPCFTPPVVAVSDPIYRSVLNPFIINPFYQSNTIGTLSPPPRSFENS